MLASDRELPVSGGPEKRAYVREMFTAIAPTYPTYQWRTPVIAALKVLRGEPVSSPWKLPQPTITEDNLDGYVDRTMPPLHYAMCGCTGLPGYPQRWK